MTLGSTLVFVRKPSSLEAMTASSLALALFTQQFRDGGYGAELSLPTDIKFYPDEVHPCAPEEVLIEFMVLLEEIPIERVPAK